MERSQRPYSIYKRSTKKKKSKRRFNVRFRDENGEYLPAISSGMTSRAAAQNWADVQPFKRKIIASAKRGVTFATFTEGFWNHAVTTSCGVWPAEGISPDLSQCCVPRSSIASCYPLSGTDL